MINLDFGIGPLGAPTQELTGGTKVQANAIRTSGLTLAPSSSGPARTFSNN